MTAVKRHSDSRLLTFPLCWFLTLALLLQVVGAPTFVLRDAATIADPIRAAQLLCSRADAGTPLDHHHKVPAPNTLQCLLNHGGFSIAFIGSTIVKFAMAVRCSAVFVGATATLAFTQRFPTYTARAPPHFT